MAPRGERLKPGRCGTVACHQAVLGYSFRCLECWVLWDLIRWARRSR